ARQDIRYVNQERRSSRSWLSRNGRLLEIGGASVVAASPSRLLQQSNGCNGHVAVDRLAHVVNGQGRDRRRGKGLHLHARLGRHLSLRFDLQGGFVQERKVDRDRVQRQGMAQG